MVNLDAKQLRFMSGEEFRVLTAVEMGMKNHEIVPAPLVGSISGLKRGNAFKLIKLLAKNKLVQHQSIPYDGYRLTAKGYDYLALKSLAKRETVSALGIQIGVGKESDIFTIVTPGGEEVCLKLHRLGRTCFRTVKNNRDYIRSDQHASWIYLSRLSALKEYAFMKALYAHGFPVPEPLDVNRHCVVMRLASGYQLNSIQSLRHPGLVFDRLMNIIVRLAEHGLIHCDFNEFNLLVDDNEEVAAIKLSQMAAQRFCRGSLPFILTLALTLTQHSHRFVFPGDGDRLPADDLDLAHQRAVLFRPRCELRCDLLPSPIRLHRRLHAHARGRHSSRSARGIEPSALCPPASPLPANRHPASKPALQALLTIGLGNCCLQA